MAAPNPVVVEAVRTPQGRQNGVYRNVRSEDLSIPLINEVVAKTGLTNEEIDDVMWGTARLRLN